MKLKHWVGLLALLPSVAFAFCGFYVGGATSKLYNSATQVVLMRNGTRTVLSMKNNYQGPPANFAMVVPVPVVLQKENVLTMNKDLFDLIDTLDAPRLVEYWEQDPCHNNGREPRLARSGDEGKMGSAKGSENQAPPRVTIEAQFTVGEYEIVILSAEDSSGLEAWLHDNNYNIPEGAEPLLRPYVAQGSKFFVAKVDISKVKVDASGKTMLSPLRFYYDTETFSLPVRLGLINSSGKQDLIVHILAKDRYETKNYQNVFIPTNLDVSARARDEFGSFYAALFDEVVTQSPKAVVTEYSWDASVCDPCPGPTLSDDDVKAFGADVLPTDGFSSRCIGGAETDLVEGNATVRGALDKDIIARVLRRASPRIKFCYEQALRTKPTLKGTMTVAFTITSNGSVSSPTVSSPKKEPALDDCVEHLFARLAFPAPQGGGEVKVTYPFTLSASPGFDPKAPPACTIPATEFTLTRLHARYSSDSLGEDLIFQMANPVAGGQEARRRKGELSDGAIESSANRFQARYIIRHEWTGGLSCAKPLRGVWGGPPSSTIKRQVKPALGLAFAKRGVISLREIITQDVPSLGLKTTGKRRYEPTNTKEITPEFYQPRARDDSFVFGLLVSFLGGILLLIIAYTSRPKNK